MLCTCQACSCSAVSPYTHTTAVKAQLLSCLASVHCWTYWPPTRHRYRTRPYVCPVLLNYYTPPPGICTPKQPCKDQQSKHYKHTKPTMQGSKSSCTKCGTSGCFTLSHPALYKSAARIHTVKRDHLPAQLHARSVLQHRQTSSIKGGSTSQNKYLLSWWCTQHPSPPPLSCCQQVPLALKRATAAYAHAISA